MMLRDLLPRPPTDGTRHRLSGNSEFRSKVAMAELSCFEQYPRLSNFGFGQLGVFVGRPKSWVISAFGNRVINVVAISAEEKMAGVHTIRSITPMKDPKIIGDSSVVENPGDSMGSPSLVVNHDLAVTILANVGCPQPAIAVRSFLNLLPKKFRKTLVPIVPNLCHVNGNHDARVAVINPDVNDFIQYAK